MHLPWSLILQLVHLLIGSDGKLYVEECGTSGDQLNSMRGAKNSQKLRKSVNMLLMARFKFLSILNERELGFHCATKPRSSHSYAKCD